ncbi:MAG TPA: hypothetical protein VG326_03930 [Tepidisphaeraceae bacterium]|jgi:hypothetical protein|nr:hypothetical protein [Tepidisphaeraceae bacterium]
MKPTGSAKPTYRAAPQSAGPPAARQWPRRGAVLVAAIGLIFFIALTVPFRPAVEESIGYFDYSWMLFLNDAVAVGRQFGKEVIYTYGPLGFIATSIFDPRTFALLIAARLLLALGVFGVLWESARKYFSRPLPALPWLMAMAALMADSPDHFFPVCAVLLLWTYFGVHDRRTSRSTWVMVVILAAASLMKVNVLMQSLVVIAAVAADQLMSGGRRRVGVPLLYLGCMAAFYLAAGQAPSSAGAFVRSWAIVSGGYIDAVALPGLSMDAVLYLIAAIATLLVAGDLHWRVQRRAGILPVAALAVIFFLLFKHSFVRQDFAHVTIGPMVVFAVAILYLPAYWRFSPGAGRRSASSGAAVLAAIVTSSILTGYHGDNLALWAARTFPRSADSLSAAVVDLVRPSRLRALRDAEQAQLRHDNLIAISAVRGTVDVYPHRLDVLFAWHFPYEPRPAVQSLIAMAPPFARLDADHLLTPRAAQTILFDIDAVDSNYLSLLDGLSWPNLLTRYDVTDTSGEFLVLRRSDRPRPYRLSPVQTLAGRFDEPLSLPDTSPAPLWACFHFTKRLAGRAISAIYKPPTMLITVHTRDGSDDASRLIPGLADAGFLLSPLMKDRSPGKTKRRNRLCFAQLASKSWREDLGANFVENVTISLADGSIDTYFEPMFSVEIDRLEFDRQEIPILPR